MNITSWILKTLYNSKIIRIILHVYIQYLQNILSESSCSSCMLEFMHIKPVVVATGILFWFRSLKKGVWLHWVLKILIPEITIHDVQVKRQNVVMKFVFVVKLMLFYISIYDFNIRIYRNHWIYFLRFFFSVGSVLQH